MQKRGLLSLGILLVITFGLYGIYWFVVTGRELRERGADIPTAWLLIIPIANLYWGYKYFVGAEKVTDGSINAVLYIVLGVFITSIIPILLAQNEYNSLVTQDNTATITKS